MFIKSLWYFALLASALPAAAQQQNRLDCQGAFLGAQAMLSGVRQFVPTSALGDGRVQFQGRITAAGMEGTIGYEGYTATAPFSGVVQGPLGTMAIGVLDNTSGRMLIYEGKASLGRPRTVGEFICDWR
jgi:hypothetical protein